MRLIGTSAVTTRGLTGVMAGALLAVIAPRAWAGTVLVTAEEAKLPPPKGAIAVASRGITRGPRIELADIDKGELHSPLHLQIKFQAFGGATIDVNSLQVTYLRSPNVDLTPRVKPFAKPTGIDIPDAEMPPGEYDVRIDVRDSDGRVSTASFMLKVTQ